MITHNNKRKSRLRSMAGRPAPTRTAAKFLLIVTEGEVTELQYFAALKKTLGLDEKIRVENGCLAQGVAHVEPGPKHTGSSPDQVVNAAIKLRDAQKELAAQAADQLEYDEVWCVMDTEAPGTPHDQKLPAAVAQAKTELFQVAISRPCFEAWLILHLRDGLPGGMNSKADARRELKKVLPEGICEDLKTEDMEKLMAYIAPNWGAAVKHARTGAATADFEGEIPRGSGTGVGRLVEVLAGLGMNKGVV